MPLSKGIHQAKAYISLYRLGGYLQHSELDKIDAKLAQLELDKQNLLSKRAVLMNIEEHQFQFSTSQKIDIYMQLFRGRQDIYANRWQNKQGRSGYSVACSNEWQQGKCNKPKVKCMECPNQAFKKLDQQAIYNHLSGKQTFGLYPLLKDDTCWLLAADFDKSDWEIAVSAFRQACEQLSIPCSIERSRSGNGAHVWIFFETPTSAKSARQLGFTLLDKAMESHAGLSFESYD